MDNPVDKVLVVGGNPLVGTVTPIPNKNSILSAIPASLLVSSDFVFKNVPKSTDVELLLKIIADLGGSYKWTSDDSVAINCKNLSKYKIDQDLGGKMRAALLLAGPLLARFGKAEIPIPGGCVLGKRSIASHIDVFAKVGVSVEFSNDYAIFKAPKKFQKEIAIWQNEASVTASENLFLLAGGIDSKITLVDSACEPHVCDLLNLLSSMGATVSGIGSNKVTVCGKKLKSSTFIAKPDFVDIGGFIVASAITKGFITIKGANIPDIVDGVLDWFYKFGVSITKKGADLIVDCRNINLEIDLVNSGFPLAGENLPKFVPRPWPGFPVDVLPPIITLACKTKGKLLINNWMYETGLEYCPILNAMGASIEILDSQKVIISGPVKFKGGNVTTVPVIQACKALFLASLADSAETTISGFSILKRRYPDIITTYKNLGANIKTI